MKKILIPTGLLSILFLLYIGFKIPFTKREKPASRSHLLTVYNSETAEPVSNRKGRETSSNPSPVSRGDKQSRQLIGKKAFHAASGTTVVCHEIASRLPVTAKKHSLLIFKSDGSLQCEEGTGISLKKMAKALSDIGIQVLKTTKGYLTTGRKPALCGEPTNNINIFHIAPLTEKQQNILLKQGFKNCLR